MTEFSKAALLEFLEMIVRKGWVNSSTGNSWKTAAKRILGDTADDADVRSVDLEKEMVRYANLHPGDLTPESLKLYVKRTEIAISQFVAYKTNPSGYKAPSRLTGGSAKTDKPERKNGKAESQTKSKEQPTPRLALARTEHETRHEIAAPDQGSTLVFPFPLRANYLAQIHIPRDLTKDEATRLCAFIHALAQAN